MTAEPITLYLDLEPGTAPDLETVAKASIAWVHAIREVAFIVEPGVDVRVELKSGTDGSLGLNTLIKALKSVNRKQLARIAVAIALWFGDETASWLYHSVLDGVVDDTDERTAPVSLTQEEIQAIADAVNKGAGRKQAEQVFREIARDPAIKGVGVTRMPRQKPTVIIPRSEFRERAGYGVPTLETVEKRVTPDRIEGILIKPVLKRDSARRWRLQTEQGELGFSMKDDRFVDDVLSGHRPIQMLDGIILDVEIQVTEELKYGVWTVTDRTITRVVGHRPPDASGLLSFAGKNDDPDEDDD